MADAAQILEEVLSEADQLICRLLKERGLEVPHLVMAAPPDGEVLLRSNIRPESLRSLGEQLIDVAGEMATPPTDARKATPQLK